MDITSLPLNLLGLKHSVREPFFSFFSRAHFFFELGMVRLMAQPDSCWRIFIMWSPHLFWDSQSFLFFSFHYFSLCLDNNITYLFIIVALPLIGLIDFVLLTMFLSDLLDKQDLWYQSHVFGINGIHFVFRSEIEYLCTMSSIILHSKY